MSIKLLAAGAAASMLALGASQTLAADLNGSPYDDPRYSDMYRHPEPRYAEPYPDSPSPPAYRGEYREGYGAPPPPAPYARPGYSAFGGECLPLRVVRRELRQQGWLDVDQDDLLEGRGFVRARRPNGYEFALRVDRCSGRVIEARLVERRPEAYAWRNRYRSY